MTTRENLAELIKSAFDGETDLPQEIFTPEAAWYFDAIKATEAFVGKRWDTLPVDVLKLHRDRMSFMTPTAFHYFFPAFLLAIMNSPDQVDVLHDNLLFHLIPPRIEEDRFRRFVERSRLFSKQQLEAIVAFLGAYEILFPTDKWSFSLDDEINLSKSIVFWKELLQES